MRWLLRHWQSLGFMAFCGLFIGVGVAVQMNVRFAEIAAYLAAGLCLLVAITSRFVPLDFGSYAHRLREHALAAYRIWRHSRSLVGKVQDDHDGLAFGMVDWLFANVMLLDRWIYAEMGPDEEQFWGAYIEYRLNKDENVLEQDRAVRRLYRFIENRRMKPGKRTLVVARQVLQEVSA